MSGLWKWRACTIHVQGTNQKSSVKYCKINIIFLLSYWLEFYFQVGEPIIKEGVCQDSGSGGHVQSMSGGPI